MKKEKDRMEKRFMGVTIAVKDVDAAFKKYEAVLGVKPNIMKPEDFAFPGIKGGFFQVGDVLINIMSSDQPETSIYKFLETKGEGIFLISFRTDDVDAVTKDLIAKGVKLVSDKPIPFSGGKVNFIHPKSMHGVQVEFAQVKEDSKFTKKK